MAMVSFTKGLRSNLPATYTEGKFYVTTDERAIYLDVDASTRIRLGDFQEFDSIEALRGNTNPNTTALYYISDMNCLAKWNGSDYIQINKDTGMTSVEVTGSGNAVTAAVYSADGRKLTLTRGATYVTAADVDSKLSAAIGDLGDSETVKAYVDAKTSGIASESALEELQTAVAGHTADISALQTALAEGGSTANAIAAAKSAADAAQADVDALSEDVGTVPEGKTVVQMIAEAQTAATYDDTEVRGLISDNAEAIEAIEADYLKAADKNALETAIGKKADATALSAMDSRVSAIEGDYLKAEDKTELQGADTAMDGRITALEGQITGLSGAMHFEGVKESVPEDVSGYESGDVIIVGNKEYVFNGTAFVEFGDVSAEGERITALETTVGDAGSGLVKSVADNAAAIAAKAATSDLTALAGRVTAAEGDIEGLEANSHTHANKALLDAYTQTEENLADAVLKKHEHANKTVLDGITGQNVSDWSAAVTKLAGVSTGANRVEKSDTNGNIKIDGAETVVYTHPSAHAISEVTGLQPALDSKLEAGDIANKADKATTLAGYGITDAYTQAQVNALLEWGEF